LKYSIKIFLYYVRVDYLNMESISFLFAFISLVIVISAATYFYFDFDKHKKNNDNTFDSIEKDIKDEETKRLSNLTSVVTQVNNINKNIEDNIIEINNTISNIKTKKEAMDITGKVNITDSLCIGKGNNVWCLKPTEDGNNLRIQRNNDKMGDNSGNIVMSHDGNIRLSKKWKNNKSVGWIYDDLIRSAKKKDVDKEFKKVNTKMLNDLNKKQDKNAKEVCIVNKDKDGNESKWCMRGDAKNLRFQRNGEKMGSNTGNVVMSHDGNIHLSKKWKNNNSVGFIYDDLIRSAKKKDVDNELQNFKDTTNDTIDNLNSRLDDINEYTKNMFDMKNKTTNTEA
jgi:hypothetical protein